jgi:hypothetical protein
VRNLRRKYCSYGEIYGGLEYLGKNISLFAKAFPCRASATLQQAPAYTQGMRINFEHPRNDFYRQFNIVIFSKKVKIVCSFKNNAIHLQLAITLMHLHISNIIA